MTAAVRREVMAEIAAFMAEAEARGEDGWNATALAYPGIPSDVLAEVWCAFEDQKTEAWWQSIERTIDGEVIRNALASANTN